MEEYASNDINYLKINKEDINLLGYIRHWKNIQIAFQGNFVWVKNISNEQLKEIAIQRIPSKKVYYQNATKLFLKESLLPDCPIPNLLWTPIASGLPVQLPLFNHNYFGVEDLLNIQIVASLEEQPVLGMLTTFEQLQTFIETAAAVRFRTLSWTIIEEDQLLILGQPLLPIQGKTYWQQQQSLIPTGYDFNYPSLSRSIGQSIDKESNNWIVWNIDSQCFKIPKTAFHPLTLSSFRKSFKLS